MIFLQATLNSADEKTFEVEFHSATYHTLIEAARILRNVLGHLKQVCAFTYMIKFEYEFWYELQLPVIGNVNWKAGYKCPSMQILG